MTFFNAFPTNRLFIGFEQPGACGLCMGLSTLRLTSVETIPDMPQVVWLGMGALTLALLRRHHSRVARRSV
jgi:hypothetical protein